LIPSTAQEYLSLQAKQIHGTAGMSQSCRSLAHSVHGLLSWRKLSKQDSSSRHTYRNPHQDKRWSSLVEQDIDISHSSN
jgi:hypothetical protein